MRLPEEIVAERFVPAFRTLLSRALLERGLSQSAIAEHLGVNQSAVSKHLGGRVRAEPLITGDPRVQETVARIADGLADGRMGRVEALAEMMDLVRVLETRGPICALHEQEMPSLQGLGCDLCVRLHESPVKAEQEVLGNVREAVRLVTAAGGLASWLPNVGSNVAMVLDGARDVAQVAALPGGLVEMKGAVKAAAPPEFGVSKHLARVLLGAHLADRRVRGAVNLGRPGDVVAAATARGLVAVEMDAADEGDVEAVRAHLAAAGAVDVVWQGGAFGVEPIAYVLGVDAVDAARKALAIVPGGAATRGARSAGP